MHVQPASHPPVPNFSKPPPERLPAFDLGPNLVEFQTDAGRIRDVVWVDEEDITRVLDTYQQQGVTLPIFKEHKAAEGSFGAMRIERSARGGIDQLWTLSGSGVDLVAAGRFMFDSPEILTVMKEGRRHLGEIRAGSLTNTPARTASQPLLMSANMMQPNKELVTSGRACLGSLGALEGALKTLGGAQNERLKKVSELLGPHIGAAVAELQGALEELDPNGTMTSPTEVQQGSTEALKMSAAATDVMRLGTEVLKLTGAASKDEALGIMEARQNQVSRLSTKMVELGIETGRLPATERAAYEKYPPDRLLAVINNSAPMKLSASAESEDPARSEVGKKDSESESWALSAKSALDGVFANHGIKKGS